MPTPKEGESRDDYMSRCMGDDKMNNEFPDQKQRAAVCNSYFEASEEYEDWGETVSTAKMEDYLFSTPEGAIEKSKEIGFDGEIHDSTLADGTKLYSPAKTEDEFITWYRKNDSDAEEELGAMEAAEYKGRKVALNKPFRTKGGAKKFAVYVKNSNGNVVIVRFGDPNMEIKRDDPKRRKAFRDRHNCSEKKDKTSAGYWSCKMWSNTPVNKMSSEFNKTDDTVSADMGDCGCGCDGESVEAKMIRKDVYDNPAEAQKRAKEMGLDGIHSHEEDGQTVFMPGKTHEEYMEKNKGKDIPKKEQDVEGYYDKDEEKKASYHSDGGSCKDGYEKQGDMCVRVAVTCDITIDNIEARVEASTGKTVIRISGVAFTDGINKNNWGIRAGLAAKLADEMVGADITLNHPKAEMGRFRRNMEGGVDEAVVGEVTEASYVSRADGYVVKYVGEVHRSELFSALESGLWMRADYGVSIGGTGIPSEIIEAEDGGRPTMWFADEFDFDHLAIVHKPAYREANIEKAVKVEANESFKYQPEGSTDYSKVNEMTDEIIEESNNASEMEALRAELVLREAKIAEFEAAEVARAEDARVALVEKATELGLKGHDDFSAETLNSVIASWEASRPAPVEEVVEMSPAEPASSEPVKASEDSEPVVANYLNGKVVSSKETLYARAYNAWVDAYNGVMINADESPALTYEELKTKRII